MPAPTIHLLQIDAHLEETIRSAARGLGIAVQEHFSPDALLETAVVDFCGCVVTGLQMPGRTGYGIQRRLLDLQSPMAMVFVAAESSVSQTVLAMRSGAATVLQTPLSRQQVAVEIQAAIRLSEKRAEHIQKVKEARGLLDGLTPRERETLPGVLSGRTNDAIAHELSVSTRTIERRRRSILERLSADCFASVVRLIDMAEQPIYPFLEDHAEGDPMPFIPATPQIERIRRSMSRTEPQPVTGWQVESTEAIGSRPEPVGLAATPGHGPIF